MVSIIPVSMCVDDYIGYWYSKYYIDVWPRVMNWNLRELDEYPNVQIIYLYRVNADTKNEYWQAGVYPYLDVNLENKIRQLGYPFNHKKIQYVGTKNYDDCFTFWGHPLAEAELASPAWAYAWIYPHRLSYYREDPRVY